MQLDEELAGRQCASRAGLLPQADELPDAQPDLRRARPVLPGAAAAAVRVRHRLPVREVRRRPRPDPGARHDPGRRAHLLHPEQMRDELRVAAHLRARPAARLRPGRLLPGAVHPRTRRSSSARTRTGRRPPRRCGRPPRRPGSSWCPTRAAPRSTARRSPCRPGTRSAGPGRCRPSRSTSTCPSGSSWSTRPPTASRQRPVMIHRALFGSIERFFGVLTEHYAGAFPAWLAPVQVVGIPVADEHVRLPRRRRRAAARARASGSRSTPSDDRMQKKIRTAQQQKVPFMLHRRRRRRRGRARCRSATATAPRTTACRSPTRSPAIVDWIVQRDDRAPSGRPSRRAPAPMPAERAGRLDRRTRTSAREPAASRTAGGRRTAFGRLWTPHRMAYIKGEDKPTSGAERGCPFCRIPTLADEDGLIVARGELVYAVLNLYPYNSGHLMVVPVPARRRLHRPDRRTRRRVRARSPSGR